MKIQKILLDKFETDFLAYAVVDRHGNFIRLGVSAMKFCDIFIE